MPVLLTLDSLSVFESLQVSLLGFLIVFIVLVSLIVVIRLLRTVMDKLEPKKAAAEEVIPTEAPPVITGLAGEAKLYKTDDAIAAVLMAIVSEAADLPFNEISIKSIREKSAGSSAAKKAGSNKIDLKKKYNFQIKKELSDAMKYSITLNGKVYEVEVERDEAALVSISDNTVAQVAQAPQPAQSTAATSAPQSTAPGAGASGKVVKAPLPGVVLSVAVNVGDVVKTGQVLMILEAMKMENEIVAPCDGKVAQILAAKGASVNTDAPLIALA